MRINHNIPALNTYNALNSTTQALGKSITRLSTGLRINTAADDAAGLTISEKMRSQIYGMDQAVTNTENGVSLIQTAEGALSNVNSILQRMRELSVQAANDSLTSQDRQYIQLEIDELKKQIDNIATSTQFNKKRLLDGSSGATWASSDLGLRATINRGLTTTDEYGQKVSAEGNYKFEINAEPGTAQVQKTHIFTAIETETEIRTETVRRVITETQTETIYADSSYYIDISTTGQAVGKIEDNGWEVSDAKNLSALEAGWSYDATTTTLKITASGYYLIDGGGKVTQNKIQVAPDVTANIELRNVNINVGAMSGACALEVKGATTVNLFLSGTNNLRSGEGRAGIEVPGWPVGEEAQLTINSANSTDTSSLEGNLTVLGGYNGAGIGGGGLSGNGQSGIIEINGGTLHVTGGTNAAGIGGGVSGHNGGGTITIQGGDVTAISPLDAGIGTGIRGDISVKANNGGTTITILGGTVKAYGGPGVGAGIGGGQGFDSGSIKIKSGLYPEHVTAVRGGPGAEDIGHGGDGDNTTDGIDLNDATLPDPVYLEVPTWPQAKAPIDTSENEIVVKESTRTVTITPMSVENELSNVELDENAGAAGVSAKGLPEGHYEVATLDTPVTTSTATLTGTYGFSSSLSDLLTVDTAETNPALAELGNNANILFEVTSVSGSTVTLKATANVLSPDGETQSHLVREDIVLKEGKAFNLTALDLRGANLDIEDEEAYPAVTLTLGTGKSGDFTVGNKFVYNFTAGTASDQTVEISGTQSTSWNGRWGDDVTDEPLQFGVTASAVTDTELRFSSFYLNSEDGTVYEGDIVLTTNANPLSSGTTLATFDAERTEPEATTTFGVAGPETELQNITQLHNANGISLLQTPQTITITQGDGKSASVTLYANDTVEGARKKLNDAIANGLGQAQYVNGRTDSFATFVEEGQEQAQGFETVAGTFVLRSVIPGKAGELTFSGSEDMLNALGLNTIQNSSESTYTVSVYDAHTGSTVVSSLKAEGNEFPSIIPPEIDIRVDGMVGTDAVWDDEQKRYVLSKGDTYTAFLHLADNSTILQTGANQGEDYTISLGDMSSSALGLDGINVYSRENASRAITILDRAINKVSAQRAKLGASQNALEYTIENLTTTSTNLTEAESRIRDADMAEEMMDFVKLQILNQSGTSMLAQANQLPQSVLSLMG